MSGSGLKGLANVMLDVWMHFEIHSNPKESSAIHIHTAVAWCLLASFGLRMFFGISPVNTVNVFCHAS